jgi:NADH:ubiquinone oxidoreductase subunit F (NADH-binding)
MPSAGRADRGSRANGWYTLREKFASRKSEIILRVASGFGTKKSKAVAVGGSSARVRGTNAAASNISLNSLRWAGSTKP